MIMVLSPEQAESLLAEQPAGWVSPAVSGWPSSGGIWR
jgi:hypothetical protein